MKLTREGTIGVFTIDTDRNNAINVDFIREAHALMDEAERDDGIHALVVTSTHRSLFCPGVDLPSLTGKSPAEMRAFYGALTGIVRRKFAYPKPEVYALNGHTIAGGLMMALAGDHRLIAQGPFYVGFMEIDVAMAAPIGVVAMVQHVMGGRLAERVLFRGERHTVEQALALGLVDEVVERERLMDRAMEHAALLGGKPPAAYRRLKGYARRAMTERMAELDAAHLDDLVEQWFSAETQARVAAAVERMTARTSA